MSHRISPNRRRSLAVLGNGPSASRKADQRKRAYSMAPGDKLSPAARARNLRPRKSILKGARWSQDSASAADDTTTNYATMTMDLTEIRQPMSRKSLARRVSFASHAHVRLFEVKDGKSRAVTFAPEEEEGENGAVDRQDEVEPDENPARKKYRRRSSTAFTGLGEQSMDMDEDDTGPIPRNLLNGPSIGDEEFDDDTFGEDDMDITQTIPGNFDQRRSVLSRDSLGLPGRTSNIGTIVTSSQFNSENQVPRRASVAASSQPVPQERLYPSLEDIPDPSPSRPQPSAHNHDPDASAVMSDMDITMASTTEHTTSSADDDTTRPMEFTIPVVRPPPRPSQAFLDLHAMTHSGNEQPYVPPEMEASDDPEANAIVSADSGGPRQSPGQDDEDDSMELTYALSRLEKARPSLGLPPLPDNYDDDDPDNSRSFEEDANANAAGHNETFSSNEDSFGQDMSLDDDNRTVNLTRMSLGLGRPSVGADSTMELTDVYEGNENGGLSTQSVSAGDVQAHAQPTLAEEIAKAAASTQASISPQPASRPETVTEQVPQPAPARLSEKPQIFTLNKSLSSSALGKSATVTANLNQSTSTHQQTTTTTPTLPNIFSFPSKPPVSAPTKPAAPQPASPVKSPAKAGRNPTVPVPFTFSVPSRLSTRAPASPTKLPPTKALSSPNKPSIFKNPAASAAPNPPKSPRKRPAPANEGDGDQDVPSPAKRQAVERLAASGKSAAPNPQPAAAATNRRTSAVRRPSGYFAQRKSLGGTTTQPAAPAPSLSRSISAPTALSGASDDAASSSKLPAAIVEQNEGPTTPPSTQETQKERALRVHASPSPAPPVPEIRVESGSSSPLPRDRTPLPPVERQPSPGPSTFIAVPDVPPPRQISPRPSLKPAGPTLQGGPRKSVAFAAEHEEQPEDDFAEDDMDMTDQWRDDYDAGTNMEDDEPTISIEQFFEMTNIRFMDEITAPRRSTIHPGHLGVRNRRRSSTSSHAETIPLAEFMTAMAVDVPQLELYHELAGQLNAWVDESKKICRQAEEDAVKVTPTLFREFAEADEGEKQDLLHQLKLIKAHNIDSAKSQWYDWKSSWVAQLQETSETAFAELENDAKILEGIISQAQEMLPSLRDEYAQIMVELEKEEADIAEIENSDKNFLSDLKVSIAEQDVEVQALQANVSEAQMKLDRLDEKYKEIETQKEDLLATIAHGEEVVQRQTESTSSEVLRLKDELEALEDLHLWRATKLSPDLKEFIYASRFLVSIPCYRHKPDLSQLRVERTKASKLRERDEFPELTQLMLTSARHVASAGRQDADLRTIIQRLSDFWTSCAQIRMQLASLAIQYPLELRLTPGENGLPVFQASAKVLFPSTKSKALISFILDPDTYSRWPLSIGLLKCEVTVAYGRADRHQILEAVQSRLSQATSSDNHGCLLDACIEATEQLAFA